MDIRDWSFVEATELLIDALDAAAPGDGAGDDKVQAISGLLRRLEGEADLATASGLYAELPGQMRRRIRQKALSAAKQRRQEQLKRLQRPTERVWS